MNIKSIKKGAFTVSGQALLSTASFVTTIYLGRVLTADKYAVFVLINSLVLILQSGHRGVFTIPFSITSRRFNEQKRANYNGCTLLHTFSYCLIIGVLIAIAMILHWPASSSYIWEQQSLVFFLFIWLSAFIFRQHLRACLLAELNVKKVFIADLTSSTLQIGGLAWLTHQDNIKFETIIMILVLASLLPALYMQFVQRHLTTWSSKQLLPHFATSWLTGKWYLMNTAMFSISSQSIPWLLLLMSTKKNVAAFGICMSSASILSPLLRGINSYLLPKMTSDYHRKGPNSMNKTVLISSIIVGCPYFFFFIICLFFGNQILAVLFDNNYNDYGYILAIVVARSFVESLSTPVTIALQSLELPRLITLSQIAAAAITLIAGVPAIYLFGLTGAAITGVLSALANFIIKWHFYKTAASL